MRATYGYSEASWKSVYVTKIALEKLLEAPKQL
jgi:hypothetical protein